MIRLAISVEGRTESEFVSQVLAPHLLTREIHPSPILLGRARRNSGGGGNVSINRLASDMATNCHRFDFVTSLVDFYGFRDKGNDSVDGLESRIGAAAIAEINRSVDESRIMPYVQIHEFEALLFSDVSAFANALGLPLESIAPLTSVRSSFQTPEDINDGPNTAPSKRIEQLIPNYNKRINGP